ncbi:hypothetical protein [Geotalea uraniireducens]|uniref:Uncharacterized protein n=1 Tax=Geotalea uraniireducens (strain Rf4) TaxID=351605 RepID=A5GEM1_GEOUR|nr:hypothetical protein [Geotalea uraniireducens]ABQ25876.1 hypothetical protein Gura_1681 [Geotalea uraniireducens Rf4]
MQILSILIVICAFYFALKYPPYTLCLYMIFSSPESYAIGFYFLNQYASTLISGAALVASVTSFYRLSKQMNTDHFIKRIFYLASLCMFISAWVWISTIFNFRNYWQSILDITEAGAFGSVIAFSYYREKRAQLAFIATVLFHITFSFLIYWIKNPYLINFITIVHQESSDISKLLSYGVTNEATVRISAHFENSIQLGFYGAVGLIIGFYLVTVPKWWARLLSFIFIGVSLWVSYATVVRSLWIFLFLGFLFLMIQNSKQQLLSQTSGFINRRYLLISSIILTFALVTVCIAYMSDGQSDNKSIYALYNFFTDLAGSSYEGNEYRRSHLISSANIIFEHPLFGLGSVEAIVQSTGGMAHQVMIAYGAMFGVPVFVAITILCIVLAKSLYIYLTKPLSMPLPPTCFHVRYGSPLFMFGCIVLAVGLSNHSAGRMLQWICWSLACLPWVYSKNTHDSAIQNRIGR